jgi:hypothetical protein
MNEIVDVITGTQLRSAVVFDPIGIQDIIDEWKNENEEILNQHDVEEEEGLIIQLMNKADFICAKKLMNKIFETPILDFVAVPEEDDEHFEVTSASEIIELVEEFLEDELKAIENDCNDDTEMFIKVMREKILNHDKLEA